jgi:hypothetical protein
MDALRLVRIAGSCVAAWAVLFLRFAAGLVTPTEADAYVHWALLPIALLIAAANGGMEMNGTGSVARRDAMWGLSAALASFAILHWTRVV